MTLDNLALEPLKGFGQGIEDFANDILGLPEIFGYDVPDIDIVPDPETAGGRALASITNFAAGFVPAIGVVSKLSKASKFLGGASKTAQLSRSALTGALVDATVFGGNEARLSDMLKEIPGLQQPLFEFLASNEEDSEIIGRMKNVLEGAGLGLAFDLMFIGLRGLKGQRTAVAQGADSAPAPKGSDEYLEAQKKSAEGRAPKVDEEAPVSPLAKEAEDLAEEAPVSPLAKEIELKDLEPGRFHGGAEVLEIDEGHYATMNVYGQGLYTTTDANVAQRYGKRRGGAVHRIEEVGEIKAFDLDGPIPDWMRKFGDDDDLVHLALSESIEGAPPKTVKELYRNIRDFSEGEGVTADGVQEIFDIFRINMEKSGFNAIDVVGKRDKGVRIYFDPSVVKTSRIDVGEAALGKTPKIPQPSAEDLAALSRRELQTLAKSLGIPANQKSATLIEQVEAARAVPEPAKPIVPEAAEAAPPPREEALPKRTSPQERVKLEKTATGARQILRQDFGIEDEAIDDYIRAFELTKDAEGTSSALLNVNQMNEAQKALHGMPPEAMNLIRLISEQGVADSIRTIESIFGSFPSGWGGRTSDMHHLAKIIRQYETVGGEVTPDSIARMLEEASADVALYEIVGERMLARTFLLKQTHEEIRTAALKAARAGDRDTANGLLKNWAGVFQQMRLFSYQQGKQFRGRQLLSLTDTLGDTKPLQELFERGAGTDRDMEKLIDFLVSVEGLGPAATAHFAELAAKRGSSKIMAFVNEVFIQSILSGPKTLVISGLGPAFLTFYKPLENMAGAGVMSLMGMEGGGTAFMQAARELKHITRNTVDFLRLDDAMDLTGRVPRQEGRQMTGRAFMERRPQIGRAASITDDPVRRFGATSPQALGVSPNTVGGRALGWFSRNVINMPGRIIMTADEAAKQINFRAVVQATAEGEGLRQGLRGEALEAHIREQLALAVNQAQRMTDESVLRLAKRAVDDLGIQGAEAQRKFLTKEWMPNNGLLRYDEMSEPVQRAITRMEEIAFQTQLAPGTLGREIQMLPIRAPVLRPFLPFVRTPLNIAFQAGQRVDLPGAIKYALHKAFGKDLKHLEGARSRLVRDMVSGNPHQQAEAIGRVSAGLGIVSFFTGMAAAGKITGGGPKDKQTRRVLEQAGWQPYSIRTSEGYVSYIRVEPFAALIGTVADVYDYSRFAGDEEQEALEQLGRGLVVGMSRNITNRTYMSGVRNLVGVLSDPDRRAERVIQQFAGAIIPNTFAQAVALSGDLHMRDIQSIGDKLKSRIPGISDNLPPLRNMFGEPLNRMTARYGMGEAIDRWSDLLVPVAYREVSDTVVNQELVLLQHGFSPPLPTVSGVNLREFVKGSQDAYDRWQELQGEIRIGGRTLRQELRQLFKRRDYQGLSPLGALEAESPRVSAIKKVLRKYRNRAFTQVLREYPTLQRAHIGAKRQIRDLRSGRRNELLQLTQAGRLAGPVEL